jgi:hypothetical protein
VAPYFRPDWPHSSLCLPGKSMTWSGTSLTK